MRESPPLPDPTAPIGIPPGTPHVEVMMGDEGDGVGVVVMAEEEEDMDPTETMLTLIINPIILNMVMGEDMRIGEEVVAVLVPVVLEDMEGGMDEAAHPMDPVGSMTGVAGGIGHPGRAGEGPMRRISPVGMIQLGKRLINPRGGMERPRRPVLRRVCPLPILTYRTQRQQRSTARISKAPPICLTPQPPTPPTPGR